GRTEAGLAAIGFPALVATAPTTLAASLLARAGRAITIEEGADIDSGLAGLPVGLLDGADEVMDTLWGIGVRTVGDVMALPRDGFARRFGASLLDQIDRAQGSLPDAQALFVAPECYHGQLELPSP